MIKAGVKKFFPKNNSLYLKHKPINYRLDILNKNVKFLQNKFVKIIKLLEIYNKCNVLKDGSKFVDFKIFLINHKFNLERKLKELRQFDFSQIFDSFSNDTISLSFDENSTILENFKIKNECLIENKIFITPEMKKLNLEINKLISENFEMKKFLAVLGPLGCGKSFILKLIKLHYSNNKNTNVLYFDYGRANYQLNTNSVFNFEIFTSDLIKEVLNGFSGTLFSDKYFQIELDLLRDLFELYSDSLSYSDAEFSKIIFERILKIYKYAKINGQKLIIIIDNLRINSNVNDNILDLFMNNSDVVMITSFEDNFSYKNFCSKYEDIICMKKFILTYNFDMIKELLLHNTLYLKYFNKYTAENWNRIIKEFLDKRYFLGSKEETTKDFSLFALIKYYTKLNPKFLNEFIHVMKQETHELENDYVILDLIVDTYEYNTKLQVHRLIRDYLTYQMMIGKNYTDLLNELNKFIKFKSIMLTSNSKYKLDEISDIIFDNFIFYSHDGFVDSNIPFLQETFSELTNKDI